MISRLRSFFFISLIGCLSIAGMLLSFTGWWLPEVSTSLRLIGITWLLVCVATCFMRTRPYIQLSVVWLWVMLSAWDWWQTTDDRSVVWFLYMNMLQVVTLVLSHLVVLGQPQKVRIEA
jgi:hypothetical protein